MTRKTRVLFSIFTLLAVLTLLTGLFSPLSTAQAREGGSLPVSPAGMITDTTPTFKWYNVVTAAKYEYELYKGATKIYTKTAMPGSCATTYCTQTPTTTLSLASYKWRIRYYIGASPQSWSNWKFFQVVPAPKDFNSNFNGSMAGWSVKPGANWYVNSTYLYTAGIYGQYSSIYSSVSPAFANFDYMVKARNTSTYTTCLTVRMGDSFTGAPNLNMGYPGYLFCFRPEGKYAVIWMDTSGDYNYIQSWTDTIYIIPYDWNRYRVVAIGPNFQYYINGMLVYTLVDASRSKGNVGIIMAKYGDDSTLLEVDYANLNVLFATSPLPDAQISPEQQALNEAAMKAGAGSEFLLP